MQIHRIGLIGSIVLGLLLLAPQSVRAESEPVIPGIPLTTLGWVEYVRLEPWGLRMRTRLDTGAKTASLSARDIEYFEKDDKKWVRFVCDYKHDKGKRERSMTLEQPIVRMVRIKRHNQKIQERPVVAMDVCFGNTVRQVEFSLIDRRGLNYPMLLGRDALQNFTLVDPSRSFLSKPDCGHRKPKKADAAVTAPSEAKSE